jgi:UDP-glucose 4-epimerase
MRTLVTGAAGFIGSTLVDRLLSEGHQVVGVDNLITGIAANLAHARMCNERHPKRFTFVRADIQAPELADVVDGTNPDVVFHLAAQVDLRTSVTDPLGDARSNVLGTINLLEACRRARVQRIIYAASGGSRYGAPMSLPANEDTPVAPLSPNAAAKLAAELYLSAYAEMCGISPISLALGSVYGPRQNPHGDSGVVTIFGSALLAGRPVIIYGDGTAVRDYVYIDDVVDAFMFAGRLPLAVMGTYNIGTGEQTTVSEVYRLVAEAVGVSSPPRYAAVRTGEVHAIALDSKEAGEELGWKPSVNIVEGIQRTVQWLRDSLGSVQATLVDA